MNFSVKRLEVRRLNRFDDSTIQRFNLAIVFLAVIFLPLVCRAQFEPPGVISVQSISGLFTVTGARQVSRFAEQLTIATNASLVRLEPALLAISAERLKDSIWHELGVSPDAPRRGQIFLVLHPAQSPDELPVTVITPFVNGWTYRVELPDVMSRALFVRTLTSVVLLELANRDAGAHCADMPPWLVDGITQQLLAADSLGDILTLPNKMEDVLTLPNRAGDYVPVTRVEVKQRGFDPLADVRRVLLDHTTLTFEQLSWPTDTQLSGADDGVYRASAQLFVSDLLELKNGTVKLRAMLNILPQFYNWQTAFQEAFGDYFPRPLDVEKWWALRTVAFAARDPGPQWTPAVSRDNLDEILSVPVNMRTASNNLPALANVSLQAVIRNFDPAQQMAILQTKVRDLALAQFRMTPRLAVVTDAYRRALADYLGLPDGTQTKVVWVRHGRPVPQKASATDTLKKLDALDAQRRTIEATIQPDFESP